MATLVGSVSLKYIRQKDSTSQEVGKRKNKEQLSNNKNVSPPKERFKLEHIK